MQLTLLNLASSFTKHIGVFSFPFNKGSPTDGCKTGSPPTADTSITPVESIWWDEDCDDVEDAEDSIAAALTTGVAADDCCCDVDDTAALATFFPAPFCGRLTESKNASRELSNSFTNNDHLLLSNTLVLWWTPLSECAVGLMGCVGLGGRTTWWGGARIFMTAMEVLLCCLCDEGKWCEAAEDDNLAPFECKFWRPWCVGGGWCICGFNRCWCMFILHESEL